MISKKIVTGLLHNCAAAFSVWNNLPCNLLNICIITAMLLNAMRIKMRCIFLKDCVITTVSLNAKRNKLPCNLLNICIIIYHIW